ncbi:thioesterase family protein [Patulibacter sp.]|uniref:thioesterase family protein n=1 Tax=Patulibacter sp. TaxID=1912859 RepID=UPI0027275946|nr:thioesterase family protein [Patulibacter sp.]MDO9408289.1 thioesterase family protein [Patulibacter sp.]
MPAAASAFLRLDEHRFLPTEHTGGAWTPDEQHISPMNGLVVHEVERFVAATRPDDGLQIGRVSFDILGTLPLEDVTIDVQVVRPGRTIELLEASVVSRGRVAERARIWRMATGGTGSVAGGRPDPLPAPDACRSVDLTRIWPGGYIASLEVRPVVDPEPGRTTAWLRTAVPLLPDEPVGALARYVGLVDTANGIAVRESPATWLYPNVDLTIHLHDQPQGPWVGLDTTVTFGSGGLGLTSTVLHDERGAVGRAAQTLTLRPRPSAGEVR